MDDELTAGPTHVVISAVEDLEEDEEVDVARFALRKSSARKVKQMLQAGDTVEYECNVSQI